MATFEDTVDKLSKVTSKLDAAATKLGKQDPGSAEKEEANEAARRQENANRYLKDIATVLSGMQGQFELKAAKGKLAEAGGIFSGIARAIGGIGAGVGVAVGGFMAGIGKAAVFAPKFVIAMGALGLGVAAFTLAVGGASAIIAETFPKLAENLKSFEGINGKNLIDVGLGMAALGVGLGAQGIGGAISSVGGLVSGIADGIGGMFGIKNGQSSLIDKMKEFGDVKLDTEAIKNNAEAMRAYGVAMMAGGGSGMLTSVATLADGVFGGIGKLIGATPPLEKLIKFGEATVNHENVKKNADAMAAYLGAMSLGTGAAALTAMSSITGAIGSFGDHVSKLFGGKGFLDTQIENLQKLSGASGIDETKVKSVAGAMVSYLGAMALGTGASALEGVASLGNVFVTAFDGISKVLGGKGVLDAQIEGMQKLSTAKGIDINQIKLNAEALVAYAGAMAAGAGATTGKAIGAVSNAIGQATDGLVKFFGGKAHNPLDDLVKFTQTVITADQLTIIKNNAEALLTYGTAMAKFAGMGALEGMGKVVSGIANGLGSFFKVKEVKPLEALKEFGDQMISISVVENNVKALHAFAQLGIGYKGSSAMKKYIDDMSTILPQVEALVNGAPSTGVSILGKRIGSAELKGLANPEIDYQAAVSNIEKLKTMVGVDLSAPSPDQQMAEGKTNMLWAESLQKSIDGLAQTIANVNTGGNVVAPTNVTNLQAGNNSPTKPMQIGVGS